MGKQTRPSRQLQNYNRRYSGNIIGRVSRFNLKQASHRTFSNLAQLSARSLSLSPSLSRWLIMINYLITQIPQHYANQRRRGNFSPVIRDDSGELLAALIRSKGGQKNKNTLSQSRPARFNKLFIINLINFRWKFRQQQMSGHRTYVCIQGAEFVQIHCVLLSRTRNQ